MRKVNKIIILCVIFLFSSCSLTNDTSIKSTKVLNESTCMPTQVDVITTIMSTTSELVEDQDLYYITKKVFIDTGNEQLSQLSGTFYLKKEYIGDLADLLIMSSNLNEEKLIKDIYIREHAISPQNKYLAYEIYDFENYKIENRIIKIVDANDVTIDEIEYQESWADYMWLSENRLLIQDSIEHNPLILFNIFSNNIEKILYPYFDQPNYDFNDNECLYKWDLCYHKNLYNSTLSRIVYPSYADGDSQLIFRNIENGNNLNTYKTNFRFGISPVWSPNGDKLAIAINQNSDSRNNDIVNQYELVVFDENGNEIISTDFFKKYKYIFISRLSWSPDNNSIAFLYSTNIDDPYDYKQIAILNTDTKIVTEFILENKANEAPIWSPNSNYVLIDQYDIGSVWTTIIDISSGKGTVLKEGYSPLGWLY
jgi:hypothetical protein